MRRKRFASGDLEGVELDCIRRVPIYGVDDSDREAVFVWRILAPVFAMCAVAVAIILGRLA